MEDVLQQNGVQHDDQHHEEEEEEEEEDTRSAGMKLFSVVLGGICYTINALTLLHVIAFLWGYQHVVYQHEHQQTRQQEAQNIIDITNFAVNLGLLLFFCFQHTFLASKTVKQWWQHPNRASISHLQRCTYILSTNVSLELVMTHWQPLFPGWNFWEAAWPLANVMNFLYGLGWVLIIIESFSLDQLEFLGVSQISHRLRNLEDPLMMKDAATRRLYEHFRHPILLAVLLVLFSTPVMTVDRLLLGLGLSIYELEWNRISKEDVDAMRDRITASKKALMNQKPG